jgi:hypothetical protein
MARVGEHMGFALFWCERCGTLSAKGIGQETKYVPKLVERCREFELTLENETKPLDVLEQEWILSGIAESIYNPEDRPRAEVEIQTTKGSVRFDGHSVAGTGPAIAEALGIDLDKPEDRRTT